MILRDEGVPNLTALREMLDEAFAGEFGDDDFAHALGGRHVWMETADGLVVSHAAVVERRLTCGGRTWRVGYVEAVATRPGWQGRGLGSAVMRRVGEVLAGYDFGALSSGETGFYERLGWVVWRGATWVEDPARGRVRTAEDDGGVMVLGGVGLDVTGDIEADWREGDVW